MTLGRQSPVIAAWHARHIQITNNNNMNNENKLSTITALRAYNALRLSADKMLRAIATTETGDVRDALLTAYSETKKAADELEAYI